jgi:hypothetical protein
VNPLVDKINPLNVLDCREVRDPPPHFHYTYIDVKFNIHRTLYDWISANLKHRFYMGESLVLDNNQFTVKLKIGFEEPKEASFFLIACPHLKYSTK